jgi:hypothetical protein
MVRAKCQRFIDQEFQYDFNNDGQPRMSEIILSLSFTGVCIPLYLFTFYRIIQTTGALSREIIFHC